MRNSAACLSKSCKTKAWCSTPCTCAAFDAEKMQNAVIDTNDVKNANSKEMGEQA